MGSWSRVEHFCYSVSGVEQRKWPGKLWGCCADDDEKQLVEHGLLLLLVPAILFIIVILHPLIFWMAGVLVSLKLGIHSLMMIITSTFIMIMLINNGGGGLMTIQLLKLTLG